MVQVVLITFIVGGFAIYLYLKQKADKKRGAAKIIIQEIRKAEKILDNYKNYNNYVFKEKIIATDSWAKNIHYFVGDLDSDELDKISELYSTGKYLDSIIEQYSTKSHKKGGKESYHKNIPLLLKRLEDALQKISNENKKDRKNIRNEIAFLEKTMMNLKKDIDEIDGILFTWEKLFKELTYSKSIYNSPIGTKLKRIARLE